MVKKVIGIGAISINLSLLLIIPILRQARHFSISALNFRDRRTFFPFIATGLMFVGMLIIGTLEVISIYRQKSRRSQKGETKRVLVEGFAPKHKIETNPEIDVRKKQNNWRMYFLIFDAVLFDYVCTFAYFLLTPMLEKKEVKLQLKPYQLLFTYFLCWYFLDFRLYRHHYISIAIIFPGFLLITYQVYQSFDWLILVLLFSLLIQSLKNILEKYLIDIKSFSIYKIMFFEGLFGSVLSIVMTTIFSYIECPRKLSFCEKRKYFEDPADFLDSSISEILFTVLFDVLYFSVLNLCYFFINKKYSPTHMVVSDIISSIIDWIIILALGRIVAFDQVLQSIGYALLLVGCLIYNEIVIIYLCKMADYTGEEIRVRGEVDFQSLHGAILDTTVNETQGSHSLNSTIPDISVEV